MPLGLVRGNDLLMSFHLDFWKTSSSHKSFRLLPLLCNILDNEILDILFVIAGF